VDYMHCTYACFCIGSCSKGWCYTSNYCSHVSERRWRCLSVSKVWLYQAWKSSPLQV